MSDFHAFLVYFDGSADLLLHKKGSIKSAQLCWVNVKKTDKTWQKSQTATDLWVVLNAVIVTLLICRFPVFKQIFLSLKWGRGCDESASLQLPA